MKSSFTRIFAVILLSFVFLIKPVFAAGPIYNNYDEETINVLDGVLVEASVTGAAITINGWDVNLNIYGGARAQEGSALLVDNAVRNTTRIIGGELTNNSSSNSTIFNNNSPNWILSIDKDSSVKNLNESLGAVSYAISVLAEFPDSNAAITNAGEISGPGAISFVGLDISDVNNAPNPPTQLLLTNEASGVIKSTMNGYAILIELLSVAEIDNKGRIIGNIKAANSYEGGVFRGASEIHFNNSGVVEGNIDMGVKAGSYLNLQYGGSITGKATFGNSAQAFNIAQGSTFNGSIAGTLGTVNLAGVLNFDESGSFSGNVIGSGTGVLNLGTTAQTLNGNLTLTSGDTLGVTFAPDGSFGNLTTTGAANVSSDSKIAVSLASDYSYLTDGSRYKILQGGAGSNVSTIADSKIDVNGSGSNGFSVVKFSSVSENNDSLYLLVSRAEASYVSSNLNSQAVYNNLNQIGSSATGNLMLFQRYIDNSISQSDVDSALKSATPQADDGIRQTSLNVVNTSFRNIENRLDQIRKNWFFEEKAEAPKATSSKLGENISEEKSETVAEEKTKPADHFLNSDSLFKDLRVWAQTFGTSAKQGQLSNSGGEGYNSNSNGFIFGFDKAISKKTNAGLALTYANSNIKALDGLKKTGVETYQISAYSGYNSGKYFLDTMASFGFNNYNSTRAINSINTRANGKFSGETYSAKIRGGFLHELDSNFTLAPESSLTFSNNNTGSYNESNAGTMNLNVRSNQTNFLEGRAGLNLIYKTMNKNGFAISPRLKVSYGYDFLGERQNITSSFEGQASSFNTQTAKYDRSSLRLGFAVDLYRQDSLSLSSEYTFEDKAKYQSHSAFLRGGYKF